MLKYKQWRSRTGDAWNGLDEDDNDTFCRKWNESLQSKLGHSLVPNWRREFHNAELYFDRAENDEFEENVEGEREEWMHLADLCANNDTDLTDENINDNVQYWQAFRANYTEEQIGSMVSWLEKKKAEISESTGTGTEFKLNVDSLNEAQRKAFNIVLNHENDSEEKKLLMMITGLAGSGKSYLINSIRALLKEKCVV